MSNKIFIHANLQVVITYGFIEETKLSGEGEGEEEQAAWRKTKKWSLWSGCSCAAALLAEEFGRERSI